MSWGWGVVGAVLPQPTNSIDRAKTTPTITKKTDIFLLDIAVNTSKIDLYLSYPFIAISISFCNELSSTPFPFSGLGCSVKQRHFENEMARFSCKDLEYRKYHPENYENNCNNK